MSAGAGRIRSLSVVLLPAPFGPRRPKTPPAGMSRDRSSSARCGRGRQNPRRKSFVSRSVRTTVDMGCASAACGVLSDDRYASLLQLEGDRQLEVLGGHDAVRQPDAVDEEGRRRVDAQARRHRRRRGGCPAASRAYSASKSVTPRMRSAAARTRPGSCPGWRRASAAISSYLPRSRAMRAATAASHAAS